MKRYARMADKGPTRVEIERVKKAIDFHLLSLQAEGHFAAEERPGHTWDRHRLLEVLPTVLQVGRPTLEAALGDTSSLGAFEELASTDTVVALLDQVLHHCRALADGSIALPRDQKRAKRVSAKKTMQSAIIGVGTMAAAISLGGGAQLSYRLGARSLKQAGDAANGRGDLVRRPRSADPATQRRPDSATEREVVLDGSVDLRSEPGFNVKKQEPILGPSGSEPLDLTVAAHFHSRQTQIMMVLDHDEVARLAKRLPGARGCHRKGADVARQRRYRPVERRPVRDEAHSPHRQRQREVYRSEG